jgi:DNA-binding NarL/FixJ family response regulator
MTLRVLLVEDDPSWAELLTEMLDELGVEIRHAGTFEEALEVLEDGPYELALLDVSLAASSHDNQDGLRVLERFRALYPHTPSIILTGYATVDLAVQALTNLRADDFLRKEQFDRRRFLETVRRVMGTRVQLPRSVSPGPAFVARPALAERLEARVLVVEDNPAWQSIYEELLEESGARMTLAVSYGEGRGLLQRERFDAAVVDLKLASSTEPRDNRDGFYLLRLTREAGLPTLVVSALGEPLEIDRAYEEHRIFAFFDKEGFQRDAFLRTLREAARQEHAEAATNGTAPSSLEGTPLAELTERQLEVLALLAQGLTNAEIAERIIVSVNTVKKHVLAIFAALGVNSRAAAAAIAARYGLGRPTDDEGLRTKDER